MAPASSAPATKHDVALIMERIGNSEDGLRAQMKTWKEEIIHEFHIVAEDIRHDAFGIQKDRIADHEHRITRLERQSRVKA